MWNLLLQSFEGSSICAEHLTNQSKIGTFMSMADAMDELNLTLRDKLKEGYFVEGACYFAPDRSKAFALRVVPNSANVAALE